MTPDGHPEVLWGTVIGVSQDWLRHQVIFRSADLQSESGKTDKLRSRAHTSLRFLISRDLP